MFEKYRAHAKRNQLKKDAQRFSEIIKTYKLELFLENSLGDTARLKPEDDFKHVLANRIHLDGNLASILLRLISQSKEKFPVCIDVGANHGFSTVFLAKNSERVFAFEPEARNIARLKSNLKENFLNNTEILAIALSNQNGTARFYVSDAATHHSLGLAHPVLKEDSYIDVPTMTLDSFCSSRMIREISVLKIDTEGFESEVLQGAESLLKEKRIKNVVFEISRGVLKRLGRDPKEITDILYRHEYKISTPDGRLLGPEEIGLVKYQDFLAFPS